MGAERVWLPLETVSDAAPAAVLSVSAELPVMVYECALLKISEPMVRGESSVTVREVWIAGPKIAAAPDVEGTEPDQLAATDQVPEASVFHVPEVEWPLRSVRC